MRNYKRAYAELLKEYNTLCEMHGNQKEYNDYLEMRVEFLKRIVDGYIRKGANEITDKLVQEMKELPEYQRFFDSDWLKQNGLLWDTEGGA